jgi:NADH-ubiquinone oxidoreductase chain 5
MAAPTPVSSLVHSSTLVTAGVYLLIRFSELLGVNICLLFLGTLTIFMSGLGANFEIDLKKIIALSTLSQLGVIIVTLSLGLKELVFFHLISHALFKSLLFLCAGSYIHSNFDIQDIRSIGGLGLALPLTRIYFIGCSLSLCGFPFLAGFYSKDIILESYFIIDINLIIYFLIFLSTIFTITYSIRLGYYLIAGNYGIDSFIHMEGDKFILVPIRVLFINSIFIGSIFS